MRIPKISRRSRIIRTVALYIRGSNYFDFVSFYSWLSEGFAVEPDCELLEEY